MSFHNLVEHIFRTQKIIQRYFPSTKQWQLSDNKYNIRNSTSTLPLLCLYFASTLPLQNLYSSSTFTLEEGIGNRARSWLAVPMVGTRCSHRGNKALSPCKQGIPNMGTRGEPQGEHGTELLTMQGSTKVEAK